MPLDQVLHVDGRLREFSLTAPLSSVVGAMVESIKAASEILSPFGGIVIEANSAIADDPALVNADPEGAGWLFRLTIADRAELEDLMDQEAYSRPVAGCA